MSVWYVPLEEKINYVVYIPVSKAKTAEEAASLALADPKNWDGGTNPKHSGLERRIILWPGATIRRSDQRGEEVVVGDEHFNLLTRDW